MAIRHTSRRATLDYSIKNHSDFTRRIINKTGEDIVIKDSSGRTVKHSSEFVAIHSTNERTLVIEEWFCASLLSEMVDVNLGENDYRGAYTGVTLTTIISIDTLAANPDGIYNEALGLHISIHKNKSKVQHPRFNNAYNTIMQNTNILTISVELMDPKCKMPTLYANIGGIVHAVVPKRYPTPKHEGISIYYTDTENKQLHVNTYLTEDLLHGGGKQGIRFYNNRIEAQDDKRNPIVAVQAEQALVWKKNKQLYMKEAKQAGIDEMQYEMKKIKREAEYKLRQAEKESKRSHDTHSKDRTGLFGNVLKAVAAVISFIGGIFAFS